MWNRIVNEGTLTVTNSTLRHAEAAIEVTPNSKTKVLKSTFEDNVLGIYKRKGSTSVYTSPGVLGLFEVKGNKFSGTYNGTPGTGFLPPFDATYSQFVHSITYPIVNGTPIAQPFFYEKPAGGIFLRDVVVANIGVTQDYNGEFVNTFSRMWNGIHVFECGHITIRGCYFNGMAVGAGLKDWNLIWQTNVVNPLRVEPINSRLYLNAHDNAVHAENTNLYIYPLNGNSLDNPTIENCHIGIQVLKGSINTSLNPLSFDSDFFIKNVNTGVSVNEALLNSLSRVFRFNINAYGGGLTARFCNTGSKVFFYQNQVQFTFNTSYSSGGSAVRINGYHPAADTSFSNANRPLVVVRENQLKCMGDGEGIFLNVAVGAMVQNNTIEMIDGNQTALAPRHSGIRLFRGGKNLINDNTITGNGSNWIMGGGSAGIFAEGSVTNRFWCNNITRFSNGIRFKNYCFNTSLGGNAINQTVRGLNMSWILSNGAPDLHPVIGPQNLYGNTWMNSSSNYQSAAANFDDPNPAANSGAGLLTSFIVQSSRFIVNPNSPPPGRAFMPPSIVLGNGSMAPNTWFQPGPGSNKDCAAWHLDLPHVDGLGGVNAFRPSLAQTLDLARVSEDSTLFFEESLYSQKKTLYESIKQVPLWESQYPGLKAQMDSLANTNLAQSVDAQTKAGIAYSMNDATFQNLKTLDTQLDLGYLDWQMHSTNQDTVQANAVAISMSQLYAQRQTLLEQWSQQVNSKRFEAQSINDGILPENIVQDNEKAILSIILATKTAKGFEHLEDYKYDLWYLANQCPSFGGEAVAIARNLYEVLDQTAQFDDSSSCNNLCANRMAQQPARAARILRQQEAALQVELSKWQVVPNPAHEMLCIQGKLLQVVGWTICNALGQTIHRGAQPAGTFSPISIADLPQGLYWVTLQQESGQTLTLKFVH
jgi:nitrous oxidase accessory protein NosD